MPRPRIGLLTLFASLAVAAPAEAIVGGAPATRDYPNAVALEAGSGQSFSHICGASLVAPDVVLTAAHCVADDPNPSEYRLLLGSRRLSEGGERIPAATVRVHPGWDSRTGLNDVALIRLQRASTLGRPIAFAEPAQYAPGTGSVVVGWGARVPSDRTGTTGPDTIHEVTVPVVSDAACGESYQVTGELLAYPVRGEQHVCAGYTEGTRDSCFGDSGGPLMVDTPAGLRQIGVVSYGTECAIPTQYGVYAEMGSGPLRTWVEQNVAALSTATQTTSTSGTSGGTTAPSSSAPAPATTTRTTSSTPARVRGLRLLLPRVVGSARRARSRGSLVVRLRATTGILRNARVTLRQRGRTVAAGRTIALVGSGRVHLTALRSLRAGRAVLTVSGADDEGSRVVRRRTVRLAR